MNRKVLFIGNSHSYFNDMPEVFARLCEKGAGVNVDAVMLTHPGMTLGWHMEQYYEVRYNLLYGHYDDCVIQQGAHPFPGYEATKEALDQLLPLCRAGGARPVLAMTWAEKRAPEHQAAMTDAFLRLGKEKNVLVSPIGMAWESMRKTHPDCELFYTDGEHASPLGDYLVACTHYETILGQSCLSLPAEGIDYRQGSEKELIDPSKVACTFPEEEARWVREAVHDAVNRIKLIV